MRSCSSHPIFFSTDLWASGSHPAGLKAIGGNLFEQTLASGEPSYGTPGEDQFGVCIQGYLEKSNVDVVQEMVNLIVSQSVLKMHHKSVLKVSQKCSKKCPEMILSDHQKWTRSGMAAPLQGSFKRAMSGESPDIAKSWRQ